MGTNYYWVPPKDTMKSKYDLLLKRITELDIEDAGQASCLFASIEDGWDEEMEKRYWELFNFCFV